MYYIRITKRNSDIICYWYVNQELTHPGENFKSNLFRKKKKNEQIFIMNDAKKEK